MNLRFGIQKNVKPWLLIKECIPFTWIIATTIKVSLYKMKVNFVYIRHPQKRTIVTNIIYRNTVFNFSGIGKNNNTRTVQAESSKFASVLFDQGFQVWVGWNRLECHLTVFCIDRITPGFVVYFVNSPHLILCPVANVGHHCTLEDFVSKTFPSQKVKLLEPTLE